jgi:hypothetical protein
MLVAVLLGSRMSVAYEIGRNPVRLALRHDLGIVRTEEPTHDVPVDPLLMGVEQVRASGIPRSGTR